MKLVIVDFSTEPAKFLKAVQTTIQGATFEDRGNPYAKGPPASKTANLRIWDGDNDGQNEFFISQGTARVKPNPEWGKATQIAVIATPFAGGPQSITVTAYDSHSKLVDTILNTGKAIPEKLMVMAPEISYLEIKGVEVSIDRIAFIAQ